MTSSIKKFTKGIWWAVTGSGIVSIIFGLAAMIWPGQVLNIFIYLFSVFVLAVSVVVLGQSIIGAREERLWWLSMVFAICGISIGLYVIMNPGVAQSFIAVLLAVYIFCQSLLDLIAASYDDSEAKVPVIIMGIIGVIFGFVVLFDPKLATEAMIWVIGLYILVHGIVTEYYAIRVRSSVSKVKRGFKRAVKEMSEAMDDDVTIEAEIVTKPKKSSKSKKSTSKK